MKKVVSLALSILMVISTLCIGTTAFADNGITTANITVKYCQSNARVVADLVNEFRTSDNAWYWNSDNKTKTYNDNLATLIYDYDLEQTAMTRACELALSFSHIRPNGKSCFSTYYNNYCGENIAVGYTNAQAVFNAWKEEANNYSNQGHRRNMLNKHFTAIAVACVYYNNCYYWVQEFRDPVVNANATTANDSQTSVDIDVLNSNVTDVIIKSSSNSISLDVAGTTCLPSLTVSIATSSTWPSSKKCSVNVNNSWSIKDTSVAKISNGNIVAVSAGSTTLSATVFGQTISVPITVKDATQISTTTTKKPKTTSIKKLTKAKKSFKVTWKKISGVNGYQIQYSTSKKFTNKTTKSVTVKKASTTSTTVKKLKSKKTYYVRIRTYKTATDGTKTYSKWSTIKKIKTK